MSSLTFLSQSAHSALTLAKGNTRILESEIRMDANRGVVITRKQDSLEILKKQEETGMGYLMNAIEQDAENTKNFIESVEETNSRIREEAEKAQEEKTQKEKAAEDSDETKNITGENQSANDSPKTAETGSIVDIVIPSTIVSADAVTNKTYNTNKDYSAVNVSA